MYSDKNLSVWKIVCKARPDGTTLRGVWGALAGSSAPNKSMRVACTSSPEDKIKNKLSVVDDVICEKGYFDVLIMKSVLRYSTNTYDEEQFRK